MADHARLSHAETVAALDLNIEREMVEFDARAQVLRLTKLPDRCEKASNGDCLRGWWSRRDTVPDCSVRDRHLQLMAWLHLPIVASRRSAKEEMQRAWDETFGVALNTSPASLSEINQGLDRLQPTPPNQLNLYAAPVKRDGVAHRAVDGPEEVKVKEKEEEEGEVQEREAGVLSAAAPRPPTDDASARFRLLELDRPGEAPTDLWAAARERLAARMTIQNFTMWVEPIVGTTEGNTLRLTAPNEYGRRWFRDHYATALEDELRTLTGREMQVAI
jgi:hypothetical protein